MTMLPPLAVDAEASCGAKAVAVNAAAMLTATPSLISLPSLIYGSPIREPAYAANDT